MPTTLVPGRTLPFIAHLYSKSWPAAGSFKQLMGPLVNRPVLSWVINGGQNPLELLLPARPAGATAPVNGDVITLTEDGGDGSVLYGGIVENLPDDLDVTVKHAIQLTPLVGELGTTPFSGVYTGADIATMVRDAVTATQHLTWTAATIPLTGITGTITHSQTSLVAIEDCRKIGGNLCQFHVDQNGVVYFGIVSLAAATYSLQVGTSVRSRLFSSPAAQHFNVIPVKGGIPVGATAPISATYDNSAGSPLGKRVLNPPLVYPNVTDQTTLQNIANMVGAALDRDDTSVILEAPALTTLVSLAAAGGATVRYWEPAVWEQPETEAGSGVYSPIYVVQAVELDGPEQKLVCGDVASTLSELAFEVDRMMQRLAVAQPSSIQAGQVGVIPPGMLGGGVAGGPGTPSTVAGLTLTTTVETVAQTNNAQLTATWTANPANENVVAYEVGFRKTGTADFSVTRAAGSPLKFAGLIQGVSYDVRIRSVNNLGLVSAWSATVALVSATDSIAPVTPHDLAAIKTPRGALVSWNTTTPNTEGDLQGYRLKVSIGGGAYQVVFDKQLTTSFVYVAPSGTALATSLTFEVAAVDWSGNYSADSAASGAVTTDGIVFDELLAGNLKVFGTLTTGGMQTASSGARFVVDSTSIRAYDGTANGYGAPSGAGVTTEISNNGTAFFSGTIRSSGVQSAWFKGDVAAPFVPSLPATTYTGFLLDPVNGLRFFNAGALTSQYQGSGVNILSGTIAGPTIYSPTASVGVGSGGGGLKISGSTITFYTGGAYVSLDFFYWNGSAWVESANLGGGSSLGITLKAGAGFNFQHDQSGGGGGTAMQLFEKVTAIDTGGTNRDFTGRVLLTGGFGTISADDFAGDGSARTCGTYIWRRADLRWFNYTATNVNPCGAAISFPQRYVNAPTTITLTVEPGTTDVLNGGSKQAAFIDQGGFHFYINAQTAVVAGGVTMNRWEASGGS